MITIQNTSFGTNIWNGSGNRATVIEVETDDAATEMLREDFAEILGKECSKYEH